MAGTHVWVVLLGLALQLHVVTVAYNISGEMMSEHDVEFIKQTLERLPVKSVENHDDIFESRFQLFNLTREISSILTSTPIDTVEDNVLRRQLVNIKNSILLLNETDMNKFENISRSVFTVHRQSTICMYDDKKNCSLAYAPQIQDILRSNADPEALAYYWKAWNENDSESIKDLFEEWLSIVRRLLNSWVRMPQTKSSASLRYSQYENIEMMENIEENMNKLKPFYEELHAYVRTVMHLSFKDKLTKSDQPIPAELLQYIQHNLESRNPFTTEVNNAFENFNVHNLDMKQLGTFLTDLDENEIERPMFSNDHQEEFCPTENYSTEKRAQYIQFYRNLFSSQNRKIKALLPIGLNQEPCPGFQGAVFKAIQLSVFSPQHLKRVGIIKDYEYSDGMKYYHLMESAVPTMFNLMAYFVNEKFISHVLNDNTTADNYTCHYWRLMSDFAGVQPGFTIEHSSFPMFFFGRGCLWDVTFSIRKIFTEIVGFQIYKALCARFDSDHALQDCDILQYAEAGRLIENAMKSGATKSWKHVLYMLTEKDEISVAALLEYYQPLLKFLQHKNKESRGMLGWSLNTLQC